MEKIFDEIYLINGFKGIYIKSLNCFAISDLQLGEELYLAEEKGIFVPQFQLEEIKKDLKQIFKIVNPNTLLVNGDLKHEFGEASKQEWREVKEFVSFVSKYVKNIVLVRGNHDNYLLTIASHLNLKVYDPFYFKNKILFTHGHKKVEYPKGTELIIIGHEQPAIILKKGFDKVKEHCLLYGKTKDGKKIICLPAFSPLASGVAINELDKEELLSPILKEEVNIDKLKPIVLNKDVGILKFPEIGKLRI